jgi:hypothetical protein
MPEPRKYTDAELTELAQRLATATLIFCRDKRISAADTASVMAVACMEVHCQCHGLSGLEHLRTAIDVGERDLMSRTQ